MAEQVVLVARPRSAPLHLDALTGLGVNRIVDVFKAPEEGSDRHVERVRQALQRGQRRRCVAVFDLRQHADGQPGAL
jgi:hypothetical protein